MSFNEKKEVKKVSLKVTNRVSIDLDEQFVKEFLTFKTRIEVAGSAIQQTLPILYYYVMLCKEEDILKRLIKKFPNVNKMMDSDYLYKYRYSSSGTVLHMAVALLFPEGVQILIENGADVNIPALEYFETPLHVSSQIFECELNKDEKQNHKKIVRLLVENGADVFVLSGHFNSPINIFFDSESWIAIEECIRSGVDLNKIVYRKNKLNFIQSLLLLTLHTRPILSPSMVTFRVEIPIQPRLNKIYRLIRLCLDFGADLSSNNINIPPLDFAVKNNKSELVKIFLKHTMNPIRKDDPVKSLGIDSKGTDQLNNKNISCLHQMKNFYQDKYCFPPGELKNIFDNEVLLMENIGKGELDGVSKALKNGAIPTGSIAGTRYPLHYASFLGHSDIVDVLLSYKVLPNILDCNGNSPLHYAAVNGSTIMCKSLLKHGAAFEYLNPKGLSPLQIAKNSSSKNQSHRDVVELLKSIHGFFKMLESNTKRGKLLKMLEKTKGSDDFWCLVNCLDKTGQTILGKALCLGFVDIAEGIMFLKFKASTE